jgi:RHS repeat-associated protein
VTRHFYYSRDWQVLEERVGTATTADRQFVWGLRYVDDLVLRVVYQSPANEVLYAVNDANFNVAAVVDDAATPGVIERYVYTPYGAAIVVTPDFGDVLSSEPWEYTYAGYRFDAETGLMQVRNRYLHAQLGRWVTRDPLNDITRLYLYVLNRPLALIDPEGLREVTIDIVVDAANMPRSFGLTAVEKELQDRLDKGLKQVPNLDPCSKVTLVLKAKGGGPPSALGFTNDSAGNVIQYRHYVVWSTVRNPALGVPSSTAIGFFRNENKTRVNADVVNYQFNQFGDPRKDWTTTWANILLSPM